MLGVADGATGGVGVVAIEEGAEGGEGGGEAVGAVLLFGIADDGGGVSRNSLRWPEFFR